MYHIFSTSGGLTRKGLWRNLLAVCLYMSQSPEELFTLLYALEIEGYNSLEISNNNS